MTDLRDTNSCLYIAFNTFFYVPGGTLYNCLDNCSAQKGCLFQVSGVEREREVYKREGISQVEAYKRGREIGHLVI